MARKPIKKRKPRKVAKKTAFPKPPAMFTKKATASPKFKLKIGSNEDPFFIHPDSIPRGVALQWVSTASLSEYNPHSMMHLCLASGWRQVKECEPIGALYLMWAPEDLARSQKDANINRARQQMADALALFGFDGQKPSPFHGPVASIAPDTFVETRKYDSVSSDASPVDVDVTIKFRASARWQDAAAALGIDVQEYVRRRLIMEPPLLASYGEVYEPVDLQVTKKDY